MTGEQQPHRRLTVAIGQPRTAPETALVVGFDRDDVSRAALDVAADLAARLAARLAVVHVVNLGDYPVSIEAPDWEEQGRRMLAEERRSVEQALAGHRYGYTYEAHYGSPVETLVTVAEAHDALMIVVGRHGSGVSEGLHRLLEGSVSRRLLRAAARPVLVVPHA